MRNKISVIGAGNVGATTAHLIFQKGYADVVLLDIAEGIAKGKALDILESGPVQGSDAHIKGTADYGDTQGSSIVIITAGIPRKPGMSRDDLLITNMKIVGEVTAQVVKYSPEATLIVVSNPLDAMVQHAFKSSGLKKNKVIGMAGVLDSARFRTFLAEALNISPKEIQAYVLGGHGDSMVPLIDYTTIAGVPVSKLLPKDKIEAIVKRTQGGGGEIVALLETGSAYYAPAASIVEMVDALVHDQKRILPCAAYLEGEYGINNLYVGVPVRLGARGIEEVLEFELSTSESALLKQSAAAVQELIDIMANSSA
tara:strand:- start:2737 stop:3672 length:936 start_codon:yes stop_codon:yes gene_type:complete